MIDQEIANNIFYHIERCWDYTYPTGQALETAIARGLEPFFKVEQKGSPSTITDVKSDDVSIDAKGNKTLKILKRINGKTNENDNQILKLNILGKEVILGVPKSVFTQVRRPKVDLEEYSGDPKEILEKQIDDYKVFAVTSSEKDSCTSIMSFVVQYNENKDIKAVTLTVSEFEIPEVSEFITVQNKKGANNGYVALNENKQEVFSLSSFNAGSSNMYKRFTTENFFYRVWKSEQYVSSYDKSIVDKTLNNSGVVGSYEPKK